MTVILVEVGYVGGIALGGVIGCYCGGPIGGVIGGLAGFVAAVIATNGIEYLIENYYDPVYDLCEKCL